MANDLSDDVDVCILFNNGVEVVRIKLVVGLLFLPDFLTMVLVGRLLFGMILEDVIGLEVVITWWQVLGTVMAQDEALVLMSGPGKRQFTGIILTQVAVSYRHELLQQISKFCRRFCGVNVRLVRASDLRIFSSRYFLKQISLLAQIGI